MLEEIYEFIEHYENNPFEGYSVFDAFNSPLEFLLKFNNILTNVIITQFFKRIPFNIRKYAFIKKSINPKSLGLALEGAMINQRPNYFIKKLMKNILNFKSHSTYFSWGYNWHYYTLRGGTFPKYYPNAIVTYFVAAGLLRYYEMTRDKIILEVLESIEKFFIQELNISNFPEGICFSYSPCDKKVIYNASALVTKFLIEKNKILMEAKNEDIISKSLSFLASRQQDNGAWFYGEEKNQKWIDSFHTEYILEVFATQYAARQGYEDNYLKGKSYYMDNFILNKDVCNYFPQKKYPINIHSIASMIIFLSKYDDFNRSIPIIKWTFENLYNKSLCSFYYEKNKYYTNRNIYHRWNQSWMYLAFNHFLNRLEDKK
ncbi:MAG: hypothetical protein GF353_25525 [Candidatus Lokiarchaeota archaeon]|nr:hypothetical protein [Candidatus Lokiarchaeota archaeon]